MAECFVVDSTILVDLRRNHPDAEPFTLGLARKNLAFTHPVCAAELLQGVLDQADLRLTLRFLSGFRRVAVKGTDLEACLTLMAQTKLSHGIGWADCLIAATCLRLRAPIVTLNDKHFKAIRGLKVIRPY